MGTLPGTFLRYLPANSEVIGATALSVAFYTTKQLSKAWAAAIVF